MHMRSYEAKKKGRDPARSAKAFGRGAKAIAKRATTFRPSCGSICAADTVFGCGQLRKTK